MALNVLNIINEIQKNLRLPQSPAITDAHAALILGFLNRVQRDIMKDATVWDALKIYGNFDTVASTKIYTVSLDPSGEISTLTNLQISTSDPLVKFEDGDFREYVRQQGSTEAQPLVYRMYSRAGDDVKIEVHPVPDAVYQIDVEAIKRPARLTSATDVPLLDEDTMISGGHIIAKIEQGNAENVELEEFLNSLTGTAINQGLSNLKDVEPM